MTTVLRPDDKAIQNGVWSIVSQKGGTGKTSTCVALAQAFAKLNEYRVLVIDLDSQANATYALGGMQTEGKNALTMLMGVPIEDCIQHVDKNIDLIPATIELKDASALLNNVGSEYKMKNAIDKLHGYDFILIDNAPALSQLTVCSLTASSDVIIPVQADVFALQGVTQLGQTIKQVQQSYNPYLNIHGILLTQYDARTSLTQEMTEMLGDTAEKMGTSVYKTRIRNNVKVRETQALQRNLFEYAPNSNGAKDYLSLAEEILWREE